MTIKELREQNKLSQRIAADRLVLIDARKEQVDPLPVERAVRREDVAPAFAFPSRQFQNFPNAYFERPGQPKQEREFRIVD